MTTQLMYHCRNGKKKCTLHRKAHLAGCMCAQWSSKHVRPHAYQARELLFTTARRCVFLRSNLSIRLQRFLPVSFALAAAAALQTSRLAICRKALPVGHEERESEMDCSVVCSVLMGSQLVDSPLATRIHIQNYMYMYTKKGI